MTDKELLELSAKAAGITWHGDGSDSGDMIVMMPFTRVWNPLTNDGDALRLAVKLGLWIDLTNYDGSDEICVGWSSNDQALEFKMEAPGSDVYAATRRAIVQAAAEIGKGGAA